MDLFLCLLKTTKDCVLRKIEKKQTILVVLIVRAGGVCSDDRVAYKTIQDPRDKKKERKGSRLWNQPPPPPTIWECMHLFLFF